MMLDKRVFRVVCGWMAWMLPVIPVAAQDMRFDVEASEQPQAPPPSPPAEGPPTEAFVHALRLYQQQRYDDAAIELQRVVEGETQDAPANVQKASFFLGKTLYHLGFYQSALAVFDEIGQQGPGHLYFDQTLQWLGSLASQLPEPAGIIEKVGRFGVEELERFRTQGGGDLLNQLVFLMGRYQYEQNEFDQAVELFRQVEKCSEPYARARFFEGMAHIRTRQARPAIGAFRAVLDAVDECSDVPDEDRMANLAWVSLGRVYYTAANRPDESGQMAVDGRLLGASVDAWNQVSPSSEYWLDSLFEASWAFFLADEYARALGNIHTLFSPYFDDAYYPEAMVLKAVTFFVNCQIDNARSLVGKFHERYDPIQTELQQVMAKYEDNTQFFEFLKRVRAGTANLSPDVRGIISSALSDRQLLQHLEYVRVLDEEEKRLQQKPDAFKNSSLGARILGDIVVAKTFAVDAAGDQARNRYARLMDELQDLMNQIDKVEVETINFMRGQLSEELQQQQTAAARSKGGDVEVDEEHQVWPFNGEYWRDELGFYRQQVTNLCRR